MHAGFSSHGRFAVPASAQITVLLALMAELFDPVPVEEMRDAEQAVREAAAALRTRLEFAEERDDEHRVAIIDIARQVLDVFLAAPGTKSREKP